jgi:CRISPR-associated protein Cas1
MQPIPIRMLNEHFYCPRLFYLMHVQGMWAESADTAEGRSQHERSEKRAPAKPPKTAETGKDEQPWPAPPRDLTLSDESVGLVGRLDALEIERPGESEDANHGQDAHATSRVTVWVPVDAKHSAPPDPEREIAARDGAQLARGAWANDQMQLGAQGLLLKANGYACEYGFIYYRKTKQRVRVEFDDHLLGCVRTELELARATEQSPLLPPPLVDSPKCPRCSLHNICLPDETNWLLRRTNDPPAHVMPSLADAGMVYVSEPGSHVGKRSESLVVSPPGDAPKIQIPWKDVGHVALAGAVQASTQLIQDALAHGRSVSWLTAGGKYLGGAFPPLARNFHLRRAQYALMDAPDRRLMLSRVLVAVKILNCRTLLRRNGRDNKDVLVELRRLSAAAHRAKAMDELMGIEGLAARVYFPAFGGLFSKDGNGEFDWQGRSRRPPRDPINALLSLGYSLLIRDVEIALRSVGLEPMAGFFHAPENGRPSLALDLMEPFRPLIADSVALRLINTGTLTGEDFWCLPGQASLKPASRKKFFAAWEQRMKETVRHPRFRYAIAYRRILELEARLFARYLEGELPDYLPLMTR